MRLDRLITLGLVEPLRRAASLLPEPEPPAAARRHPVPILMYHSVSDDPEPGVGPYYRTAVTPGRFAEHMRFLRARGWRALGLRQGLRAAAGASEKIVILTFDDGFRDFASGALPVLQDCGFGATLFLPTAFMSERGLPRQFCGRDCLTWREIDQLRGKSVEFGSHTCHHPQLWELPWSEIEAELTRSKSAIEDHLDVAVTSFSYPYAFPQNDTGFCARLRGLLRRTGYQACTTTEIGRADADDDPYRLRRLPMNEADDLRLFAAKLEGAYDWLAVPQRVYKTLRRALPHPALKPC